MSQEYVEVVVGDRTVTMVRCDKCGGEYREGEFPFCRGRKEDHGPMHGFDDSFEPYVDVQILDRKDPRCDGVNEMGTRGVTIYSRSQRRNLMKSLDLQYGTQKFERRGEVQYYDMKKRG